jgi:phosphatidylglycerol:prolipoprotein diacylglycerol transferase
MIDFTPNPIAFSVGPVDVRWYGIAYILAIAAGLWLVTALARRRGERTDIIVDGLIVIAAAALVGGRAYHVIDQWAYYKDHLANIVLPPYSGLGIYGGLFTGLLATIYLTRHWRLNFWRWGDIIAPCILLAQAVGRWGNFMNQELYGPPTTLPWGIAIQCQYRVPEFACPAGSDPTATLGQHFIPLFLYESILSLTGVLVMIWLWGRFTARGRLLIAGDVGLLYFVWYGLERALLEFFRFGYNWTFFGVPMAQIVGLGAAAAALIAIAIRHRWVRAHPESAMPAPVERSAADHPATEAPAAG